MWACTVQQMIAEAHQHVTCELTRAIIDSCKQGCPTADRMSVVSPPQATSMMPDDQRPYQHAAVQFHMKVGLEMCKHSNSDQLGQLLQQLSRLSSHEHDSVDNGCEVDMDSEYV